MILVFNCLFVVRSAVAIDDRVPVDALSRHLDTKGELQQKSDEQDDAHLAILIVSDVDSQS